MDVSVIIVNYNTLKMTSECIDSIIEKTHGIIYEIILVDNGSTDGSKEHFEQDTRIKYIYSTENLGFGRANNLGAKYAQGYKLFFLNPDTVLINNAIWILSNYLSRNHDTGVVGGNLYNKDLKSCLSYKRYLPGLMWELNNISFSVLDKLIFMRNGIFNFSNKTFSVGYITGADLMMSKSLFNILNGFDEDFFLYYEETDLCARIANLGYKIKSVPDAKIYHLEGASFEDVKINKNRIIQTEIGRRIYYRKHFTNRKRKILNMLYWFNLKFKSVMHPNPYRRMYSREQLFQFEKIWIEK